MTCTQSQTLATGDGTTTQFTFTFEYMKKSDINVSLYNTTTEKWEQQSRNDWSFAGDTVVEFNIAPPQSDTANIIISRTTNIDTLEAEFYAGSAIRAQDLNNNFDQLQRAVQDTGCGVSRTDGEIIAIEGELNTINDSIQENADKIEANTEAINNIVINPYELPIASPTVLGGIKVGANLTINQSGILSAVGSGGSSAITFKGTADFTAAAPDSPATGDLYLNSTIGTGAWNGFVGVAVTIDDRAFFNGVDWDRLPAGSGGDVPEAPNNGIQYGRQSQSWTPINTDTVPEAPNDGKQYARQALAWQEVQEPDVSGFIDDAPSDGKCYVRKDASWYDGSLKYLSLDFSSYPLLP